VKFEKLLFGLTLFFVTFVGLANLTALTVSSAIFLPLLGVMQVPLLLIGLLSVTLTALVFLWVAKLSFNQTQACRVKDLEKMVDLQRILDLRTKQERTSLQASLDSHATAIMARLETMRSNEAGDLSGIAASRPSTGEPFFAALNREMQPFGEGSQSLANSNLNLR
jgi:hypothetical protein